MGIKEKLRAPKIKASSASLLFAAATASEAHVLKVGVSSPPQDTVCSF